MDKGRPCPHVNTIPCSTPSPLHPPPQKTGMVGCVVSPEMASFAFPRNGLESPTHDDVAVVACSLARQMEVGGLQGPSIHVTGEHTQKR